MLGDLVHGQVWSAVDIPPGTSSTLGPGLLFELLATLGSGRSAIRVLGFLLFDRSGCRGVLNWRPYPSLPGDLRVSRQSEETPARGAVDRLTPAMNIASWTHLLSRGIGNGIRWPTWIYVRVGRIGRNGMGGFFWKKAIYRRPMMGRIGVFKGVPRDVRSIVVAPFKVVLIDLRRRELQMENTRGRLYSNVESSIVSDL